MTSTMGKGVRRIVSEHMVRWIVGCQQGRKISMMLLISAAWLDLETDYD